jgi:hypothetical protein
LKSLLIATPRDNINEGSMHWHLPVRYSNIVDNHSSIFDPGFISDLYYADIYDGEGGFSTWDTNGDGIYGGWSNHSRKTDPGTPIGPINQSDIIDFYPDIYVGRLPCRNKLELRIMINKIINYEKNSPDPQWFNRFITIGGDPYDDQQTGYLEGELICEKAISYMPGFTPIRLFSSHQFINQQYTPLKTNIIREISQGAGFLLFDGHGSPSWWNTHWPYRFEQMITDGGISISDFHKLKNQGKLPICIIGGCHCSLFNVSLVPCLFDKENTKHLWSFGKAIPECFSWWLTRKLGGGAIATIGTTGLGYEDSGEKGDLDGDGNNEPDCVERLGGYLETQFFRAYGVNQKDILGEAWGDAITQYLEKFPGMSNRTHAKTVEQWIIFGDPTLKIGGYEETVMIRE